MKSYSKEILNELLNKYEKSALFKGTTSRNIRIKLDLNKFYPDYGTSLAFSLTEDLEDSVKELKSYNYIIENKKNEYGFRIIYLNVDCIDEIYKSIHRTSKKTQNQHILDYLETIKTNDFIFNFIIKLKDKINNHQSSLPYLSSFDLEEIKTMINILNEMLKQDEEISLRKFSIKVLNDSKKLSLYKNNIYHIIHDFYDDSINNEDEALELFHIIKNPSYVYIKGNIRFYINNQYIDTSKTNKIFIIPSSLLDSITIDQIYAHQVLTIENLTSFNDLSLNDTLMIYLGGFHNSSKRIFLNKIYECLPNVAYYHFGDIDAGGFYIYLDLCHKTSIPFIPYKMDIETLKQYRQYTKPLTENDVIRLNNLKINYDNPIIDYMLENNIKLEQEIIDIQENNHY